MHRMKLLRPLLHEGQHESVGSSAICQHIYPAESGLTWTAVFCFQNILVGFILPGLVILICYCIIISSLSRGDKGQVLKKKKKPLKNTVILVVCFFGCWLPYCLGSFVDTLTMLNVGAGLLQLLPEPHPLCLPGCEVQPNRQEHASDHHRQQQRRLM
ncbi:hypothetical protein CRENBAI_001597 [Crenichthys baileyi]|uniref:G-protein coupled receptors family 1 profile domain-containing protein n=1 Tax=Crenichthys baileyi TaxID=28760 RepID=A0AAV9SK24_9TELE